ncbi:MAG: DUF3105 domain-containing protein [Chloroflexi bacterium]|nr:DUF3105 domain-containing protein [Chloroflexota bacterium]
MAAKQKQKRDQLLRKADQREQRRERSEGRKRKRRILYLSVSAVIAVLVIASFALPSILPGRAAQSGGAKQATYVQGVGQEFPPPPSPNHVDGRSVTYSTIPPTSGDHWGSSTQCGFYTEEIRDEIVVHNMEHGNVIVSYNLDNDTAAKLKDYTFSLRDNEDWLVTRPYPKLSPGEVAIAVWGIMDKFTGVDEARIKKFFDTYKGNTLSPETRGLGQGIPCTTAQRMAQ